MLFLSQRFHLMEMDYLSKNFESQPRFSETNQNFHLFSMSNISFRSATITYKIFVCSRIFSFPFFGGGIFAHLNVNSKTALAQQNLILGNFSYQVICEHSVKSRVIFCQF